MGKNGQKLNTFPSNNTGATVNNNKLFYNNIYGNITAEFEILTGKRKLTYIIPDDEIVNNMPIGTDYLVFSEDILLPHGWKYEIKGTQVLIYDDNKNLVTLFHTPRVFEKYEEDNNKPVRENPTKIEVIENGNRITYLLKVKTSWISSPEREYPLGIDPTLSFYPNDENLWSGFCDSGAFGADDDVWVGFWFGDEIDGFVRFNISGIPAGSTITGATSGLYRFQANGNMNNNRYYVPASSDFDPRHWVAYTLLGIFDMWYYYDMFNSYTGNVGGLSTSFSAGNSYKTSTFTSTGHAYIQNNLVNGFVNVLFWPYGASWVDNNYGRFRGYSAIPAQKPYLEVTYNPACTIPSSTTSDRYISNVQFLGTLNPDTSNTSTYSTSGYGNYTALSTRAKQIPGGGINVFVNTVGNATSPPSFIKAWVDWNKDGIYDPISEEVFNSDNILTTSTTFGFIVPPTTVAGNYNIRIRNYFYGTYDEYGYYFGPCGARPNGETEDYTFEIIDDCAAKITSVNIDESHGHRCGPGSVTLSATGTGTSYHWYTSEFGGSPIAGATGASYNTPSISTTTIYYVTALNGSCESVKRTPVIAKIDPIPEISFTSTEPEMCGNISSISVTSSGDKEEITIFEENFNSSLGSFIVSNLIDNGGSVNAQTQWQNESSVYIPQGAVWFPAISSGDVSDRFAFATSDLEPGYNINTALTTSASYDTNDFISLKLDFEAYFSYFNPGDPNEGLYVEVSTDGSSWTTIHTYQNNIGIGTRFEKLTVDLSSYVNQTNLRIRFRYRAGWADGIAIDKIRLYGDFPLSTAFEWSGDTSVIFDEDCTTPYSGASTTVCVKPTDFENDESWEITATATLSNGCSASGTIEIENKNKVWNTIGTNWATLNWKPGAAVPTADDCVIIRTPVNLTGSTDGLAKNLKLENTGSLSIQPSGSLTVTDFIVNEAAASAFVVESDANLLQINPAENTGQITVKRSAEVPFNQYNFWSSPVAGQNMYSIYPNIPNNRVMEYNTATDFYTILANPANSEFGKAYSIKGPSSGGPAVTSAFIGVPHNETLTGFNWIPLVSGVGQGFNLIGNPYPSNLNLLELYDYGSNDTNIDPTFYFWDNVGNTAYTQEGPDYEGINFATYNANFEDGTEASGGSGKKPNGIVKPGQGFIVQAIAGSGIQINNTMRTTALKIDPLDDDAPYYKNGLTGEFDSQRPMEGKFWLELVNPNNLHIQIALGYFEQADHAFDKYDTPVVNESASDNLYSFSTDAEKLTINGRGPFTVEDVIPLGVGFYVKERYRIQLEDTKGIFVNHQNIYLKDKYLNLIHNLSSSPYEFESLAGEFTDRFEVVFKPEGFTNPAIENQISIVRQGSNILVSSSLDKIIQVEVFNLAGWQVYKKDSIMSKEILIPATSFDNQIIVVTVLTEKGEKVSQKLVNK